MKTFQVKRAILLAVAGLGLGLAAIPRPAQAQWLVECLSGPGIPCASSVDVQATNTQLTTTHTYLATGMGGSPGGAIALLGGINERLGMVTNANDEAVENADLAARQRIYDERMMDVRGQHLPKPSGIRRACVQATTSSGRAAAARASGGAAATAAENIEERFDDARPQVQALIDAGVKRAELGTCSATDVAEKRPGCQGQGGAGDRPNADLRAGTLFDGGKKPEERNLSIDEQGFKIGQQFISNVVPLPADKLTTDAQKKSENGIIYMLHANRYNSRLSPATEAMTQVLGFGTSMGVVGASVDPEGAAGFLKAWASKQADYEAIFGAGTFPEKPSERQMLQFAVFDHYANAMRDQKESSYSEAEQAQIEIAAVNARVNLAVLERLEMQNLLLSALLSHEMDPLTMQKMADMRADVTGQSKTNQE